MAEHKQNRFLPYLREDRLPHIFCPGCGNGAIINAFLAAMEKAEMDFDNIAMAFHLMRSVARRLPVASINRKKLVKIKKELKKKYRKSKQDNSPTVLCSSC